jgi:putative component of membrane protein insertase Oxa1/YidC/SpoIIIJ protein YidD
MGYPGQTLLIGLIAFYRRWLSGRGPLRRVACTFCRTESCSAYGLRVARAAARSLPEALRLIRARLRRCRRAALYRLPDGWAWGACYDLDGGAALARELDQALELPATRAAVLWSAALVARHCGDGELALDYVRHARQHAGPAQYVAVRDGRRLAEFLRRRAWVGCGVAVALGGAACTLPSVLAPAGVAAAVAVGLGAWRRSRGLRDHFALQFAANRFRIPGAPGGAV